MWTFINSLPVTSTISGKLLAWCALEMSIFRNNYFIYVAFSSLLQFTAWVVGKEEVNRHAYEHCHSSAEPDQGNYTYMFAVLRPMCWNRIIWWEKYYWIN